jgi:EPS-associated MarR family transcriptional regulator
MDDFIRYHLLKLLHQHPEISQRELARRMGISLGKTNFCLQALIKVGAVKTRNFRNAQKKSAYLYKLTPAGIEEKARVTRRFLERKMAEYEEIREQIAELEDEVAKTQEERDR